jgi:hypothetical protein
VLAKVRKRTDLPALAIQEVVPQEIPDADHHLDYDLQT